MQIKIPTPDELGDRLGGIDRLLTAKTWERAAIVFAYTTNEGKGGRQNPAPPKMTMREFARQGYAGLSSNKTVERYRAAWVTAIDNRWTTAVWPGDVVELPDQPFPAWPSGAVETEDEDFETGLAALQPALHRTRRPLPVRVVGSLGAATTALRRFSEQLADLDLDDEARAQLAIGLTTLRDEIVAVLDSLDVSVEVVGG